jgi:hypothetical protein
MFLITIILAIYFKRPAITNNNGLPFIAYKVNFLGLNKYYTRINLFKKYINNHTKIKNYTNYFDIYKL